MALDRTILQMQFQLALVRAQHFHTRATTGVYKTRVVHKGSHDGPLMNEEELLADEVRTANTHLRLAQDCLDAMPPENQA